MPAAAQEMLSYTVAGIGGDAIFAAVPSQKVKSAPDCTAIGRCVLPRAERTVLIIISK